jgi:hypothetical protein
MLFNFLSTEKHRRPSINLQVRLILANVKKKDKMLKISLKCLGCNILYGQALKSMADSAKYVNSTAMLYPNLTAQKVKLEFAF